MQEAIFGAGCFWGVQDAFDQVKGVTSTSVGYSGGHFDNPTYEDVCSGTTGHAEVVKVEFDIKKVSFEELLQLFWNIHDPTTLNRQGPDVGSQYRSAIFYHTEEHGKIAAETKKKLEASSNYQNPIVTEIIPAKIFYPAEEYHQQYFKKRGISHCKI
jgi:peptide-methionine (S)-S-oxide reductase